MNIDALTEERLRYEPELAPVLTRIEDVKVEGEGSLLKIVSGRSEAVPPLKVGVFFSGGPASGAANVVCGVFDALMKLHPKCKLYGFINGPTGLLEMDYLELSESLLAPHRNMGGFHLLGTSRTKFGSEAQFEKARVVLDSMSLDGLVVIGGDDSNTNAAHLATYLQKHGQKTAVIGIPKTIDGDLQTKDVEISFGFDTACKTYSEMIGNIGTDAMSSRKYWHIIRLMGRKASHVALECALITRPNIAYIGEEISERGTTLADIVKEFADVVEKRSKDGKNYGVALISEGLVEFIPSMRVLIEELNHILAKGKGPESLTAQSNAIFNLLPDETRSQLLEDRDPHGNVQVAKIETERLMSMLVTKELEQRNSKAKFNVVCHYFGYEGRCPAPSNFDATYCYNLGYTAAFLIKARRSGYMAAIKNLAERVERWEPIGVKIKDMLVEEIRGGESKLVIDKALVELDGKAFREFAKRRDKWAFGDCFRSPGPIQFNGPAKDMITNTLSYKGPKGYK